MGCLLPSLFGGHVLVFDSFLAFLHCNGAEKAERKKLVAGTGCEGCTFQGLGGLSLWGGLPSLLGGRAGELSHEDITKRCLGLVLLLAQS